MFMSNGIKPVLCFIVLFLLVSSTYNWLLFAIAKFLVYLIMFKDGSKPSIPKLHL